jgi:hypothetical protein
MHKSMTTIAGFNALLPIDLSIMKAMGKPEASIPLSVRISINRLTTTKLKTINALYCLDRFGGYHLVLPLRSWNHVSFRIIRRCHMERRDGSEVSRLLFIAFCVMQKGY